MRTLRTFGALFFLLSTVETGVQATVVEDAEDGNTNRWRINDNNPSGASINNLADSTGRYINLAGAGTSNSYLFGSRTSSGGLNITGANLASFHLRNAGRMALYYSVQTSGGRRDVVYDHSGNTQPRLAGNVVLVGQGNNVTDGNWHIYNLDLQAPLSAILPGTTLTAVNGLLVYGSLDIDDIAIGTPGSGTTGGTTDGGTTPPINVAPQARAGADQNTVLGASILLDGSTSTDSDGSIVTWAWRDGGNQLFSSSPSFT